MIYGMATLAIAHGPYRCLTNKKCCEIKQKLSFLSIQSQMSCVSPMTTPEISTSTIQILEHERGPFECPLPHHHRIPYP